MFDLSQPSTLASIPTVMAMLRSGSSRTPERILALFEDGETWTWAEAHVAALKGAAVLQGRGLQRGDRLCLMMQSSREFLALWWGASALGLVIVPLNTALRGGMLSYVCQVAAPSLIVSDVEFERRFEELSEKVTCEVLRPDLVDWAIEPLPETALPEVEIWAPHALILTSGTTGPSKASVSSLAHLITVGNWAVGACSLDENDRFMIDLPMCHLAALSMLLSVVTVGGSFALRKAPAMGRYWEVAREAGTTIAVVVGTMAEFLLNQPPSASDREHKMRVVLSSPLPVRAREFRERFGVDGFITSYGSTEANIPLVMQMTADPPLGTCGKVRAGFEVRLVDENDLPVPEGEIGEVIVRCSTPWVMSLGYFNDSAATAKAWRNGWFHTGDLMRRDHDGYHFFHDRSKDSLRRRGENISSFEVEREVMAYTDVLEAACVPVAAEVGGDDEVKVFIVPKPGAKLDLAALHRFLAAQMPHFMVPRFYELIDHMPKTPSARIQKHELRAKGNSAETWDSEAAGLRVTRHGLQKRDETAVSHPQG